MRYQYIVLIVGGLLFLLSTIIELYYGFKENEIMRKKFKVFPTAILDLVILICFPDQPLIYLAVFCGFLGDLLLIWEKNQKMLYVGGFLFFVGHVLYLIAILLASKVNLFWYHYIIGLIGFIALFLFVSLFLHKKLDFVTRTAGAFYFFMLLLNLITSIALAISLKNYFFLIFSAGYLLFIISDTLLGVKLFVKEFKKDDFYIMSSYLIAQILISTGLLIPLFLLF